MFKNESMIIQEWIEHNIKEGVEHFYLIDNGSDDNYIDKIKKYMNLITLVKDPYRKKLGTQTELFNKHFLDIIKKETEWVIVIDIDEYVYSRNGYSKITDYINKISDDISQIILPWKMFGSNTIIKQPLSIISSFTKREDNSRFKNRIKSSHFGYCKALTRVSRLKQIETHKPTLNSGCIRFSDFSELDGFNTYFIEKQYIHINHYTNMSLEYYTNIKIKRGGGQGGVYTLNRFNHENTVFNEVEDIELKNKET